MSEKNNETQPSAPSPKAHWVRRAQITVIDLVLTAAGLFAIFAGFNALYSDNTTLIATCMGTGLVLLFAATIQRFELIKGLGIEAKVKHLDAQIVKAEVSLAQFKSLAESIAPSLILLSSKMGRPISSPSVDEAYATATQVRHILKMSGSAPDQIRTVLLPWARITICDLAHGALSPLREAVAHSNGDALREITSLHHVRTPETEQVVEAKYKKQQEIFAYLMSIERAPEWELSEVTKNLRRAVLQAPGLADSQKSTLLDGLSKTISEIDYFHEYLDFNDIDHWRKHSIQLR